jgi:hypothetical protein
MTPNRWCWHAYPQNYPHNPNCQPGKGTGHKGWVEVEGTACAGTCQVRHSVQTLLVGTLC